MIIPILTKLIILSFIYHMLIAIVTGLIIAGAIILIVNLVERFIKKGENNDG